MHVVLPCLNEERILPATLERLCGFLERQDWQWRVTVVDNGSTDGTSNTTLAFARSGAPGTAPRSRNVALMRLEDRGRGLALRNAWLNDSAAIQSYMDVDLSTDLDAFSALVHTVHNGSADVAVASRHAAGAQVARAACWESTCPRARKLTTDPALVCRSVCRSVGRSVRACVYSRLHTHARTHTGCGPQQAARAYLQRSVASHPLLFLAISRQGHSVRLQGDDSPGRGRSAARSAESALVF